MNIYIFILNKNSQGTGNVSILPLRKTLEFFEGAGRNCGWFDSLKFAKC